MSILADLNQPFVLVDCVSFWAFLGSNCRLIPTKSILLDYLLSQKSTKNISNFTYLIFRIFTISDLIVLWLS